jgi:predicted alpha/beta superfamily hydrolase
MKPILTILFLLHFIALWATEFTTDTIIINSSVLNETRTILIFKPSGLELNDTVDFVYLLDGEFSTSRYCKIACEQFEKPIIGVGIVNTNRNRDMLPVKESCKFLNFIVKELITEIENGFMVDQRILFGHSFAGGFTLYAMIEKSGLFDKYIASSPTPIMNYVDSAIYKQLDKNLGKRIKFYYSYGSNDMKQVKKWGRILSYNLANLDLSFIDWKNEIFEGQNHNTCDVISLINGLKR